MRIVLASSSPYRQSLLRQIGLPFEVAKPDVDEARFKHRDLSPPQVAQALAALKGEAVAGKFPNALIIACDQVAHFKGEILNKPGDSTRAAAQLRKLSGQRHSLSTALWVRHPTRGAKSHVDEAHLLLRNLSDEEILAYVNFDHPEDCAGAYKIEGAGISLIEELEMADQSAIVGLPLIALCRILREWQLPAPFLWPKEN